MGGSKSQTVGYKYSLGIHMILCHGPIDSINKISVDDRLAWSGSNSGGTISVDAESLFGGESREGGIVGDVDIEMGGPTQAQNTYLSGLLGTDIPNYRGVVGAVLKQVYIGLNPYLKKWAFRATRNSTRTDGQSPLAGVTMAIGNDMNPVSIIHECLTDGTWGLGYNYSDIDEASFVAAGTTLTTEGMGISLLWDGQMKIEDFILEILKHIDGNLYVHPRTGLFTLSLIREDYVFANLPILDETNISQISEYSRPVVGELINSVTVVYWSSDSGQKESLTVQDIALQMVQQQTINTTFQYPGFTNGDIAAQVASRDLHAVSTPLISCTILATREASELNIGDPFRLQWPDLDVDDVVMRVQSVGYGSQGSGKIQIVASQDVYSVGDSVVAAPPVTEWTDYRSAPSEALNRFIYEIPYWEVVMRSGQGEADALGEFDTGFLICASRPTPDALFAELLTNGVNGFEQRNTLNFSPAAVLDSSIGRLDTTITFAAGADNVTTHQLQRYIQIDEELLNVVSITSTQAVVERGVLDTIPEEHSAGARVYFNGDLSESDGVTYQYNETVGVKLSTVTGLGTLAEGSTPADTKSLTDYRQFRPYPPAYVTINSSLFPATILNTEDIAISAFTRSRLQLTTEKLYPWTYNANLGEETGTTYNIRLLQSTGTLIVEQTGLSSPSHTFLLAEFSSYTTIRVQVESVRDGYTCLQVFDHQFDRV